jgi:hypothetical protein
MYICNPTNTHQINGLEFMPEIFHHAPKDGAFNCCARAPVTDNQGKLALHL